MSKRVSGTLVGIICSLAGVVIWVILGSLGIIAGLAGAVMGILFILPYMKINSVDRSAYPYIVGSILIVVEIVISELLMLAILAASAGVSFGSLMGTEGMGTAIVFDIVLGVVLSGLVFGFFIFDMRKKQNRVNRSRTSTAQNAPQSGAQPNAEVFDEVKDDEVFDEVKDDTAGVKDDTHTDGNADGGDGWRTE